MKFLEFNNLEDGDSVKINPSQITIVVSNPSRPDVEISVQGMGTYVISVPKDDFEEQWAKIQDTSESITPALITKLTQAIDRLTVHIPSSIRMHM